MVWSGPARGARSSHGTHGAPAPRTLPASRGAGPPAGRGPARPTDRGAAVCPGGKRRRTVRRSLPVRAALALAVLFPLAACGTGGDSDGPAAEGFPRTVENCGVKTTFQKPPERVVTMNQHATEAMLALGLEDRMVGTAYLDDKVLPRYADSYRSIDVLAKRYPSKEVLLGADPDFVYGGYSTAFDRGEGRDRAALEESGIDSRLNIESCSRGEVGFPELRRELLQLGRTFDVEERAEKLVASAEKQLAATAKRVSGERKPDVFVYDSGESSALTAGGHGIGNDIIERAGGRNVFAGISKPFADVSWEQVVKRNPDVIVVYDYGGTPVADKKKRLLNDPALRDVPAVKNERFAVLPLSSAVLGVRVPDAVDDLAEQLHPTDGE